MKTKKSGLMNLHLPLETIWFRMTGPGGKPEDYRKVNDYWCRRLFEVCEDIEWDSWQEFIEDLNARERPQDLMSLLLDFYGVRFKQFTHNVMTLGYPKKGDPERTKVFEHLGIEIRTGNLEWGAEPGEIYFVIKHGKQVK